MASPSRASGRSVNVAQLISMFLAFLLVAGVAGVLSAGFLMPMVAAVGATSQAGIDMFDELDTDIGDMTMSERSVIRYSDGSLMATFYAEDRIVVPLEEISPHVQHAVVAVEDKRFYEHGAIDPEGMLRALLSNLGGGDLQGASTLTQQYVKNVLLEQAARNDGDAEAIAAATARTIGRKLREAKLAIALEQSYTKDEILNGYLNIALFGPAKYGIEAASRYFFSKSALDLTIGEAALLAGITRSPASYNPLVNPENAFDRRNTVLDLMADQGYITQAEYEEFSAQPIEDMITNVNPIPATCATAGVSAYFCDYVVETILQSPEFGETQGDRWQLLMRGGLDITTTLNPTLQQEGFASLTAAVPVDDESGISNAISTVEPGTGRILAMVQNTPYGEGGEEGDPARTTKVNFNADAEYGGSIGFQTGSTFKAFVLAAWLESGHSLYDTVDGSQGQKFPASTWNYDGCESYASSYDPKNIEGIGTGRMRVIDATIRSVNTAFANMANQLNMCDMYDLTQRLGLHVGSGVHADSQLPLYPSPSMVLGSNNIAPLTMAAAFATFASNGTFCTPIAIDSILDSSGNAIAVPAAECSQAIKPEVAATVTYALHQVVSSNDRGATGREARISGYEVAGKTGTANEDYAAWFIGFTPQVTTAVWNGFSEGQIRMMDIWINGRYYSLVYGGAFAAPIWQNYMSQAVSSLGLTPQSFPDPNDKLVYGERKWVPNVGGMSVDQATATLERSGFEAKTGSSEESDSVPAGAVIRSQPGAGSLQTQGTVITLITSSGPPPEPDPTPDPTTPPPDGGDDDDGPGNGGGGPGNDDDGPGNDDDGPGNGGGKP